MNEDEQTITVTFISNKDDLGLGLLGAHDREVRLSSCRHQPGERGDIRNRIRKPRKDRKRKDHIRIRIRRRRDREQGMRRIRHEVRLCRAGVRRPWERLGHPDGLLEELPF